MMHCECAQKEPKLHVTLSDGVSAWMNEFYISLDPLKFVSSGQSSLAQEVMKWIADLSSISFESDWKIEMRFYCGNCKKDLPHKITGKVQTSPLLIECKGNKTRFVSIVCLALARGVRLALISGGIIEGLINLGLDQTDGLTPGMIGKANFTLN